MKILIVDGNSFSYRAFYAVRDLRNSKGEPTNAVYGFITMLEKLLKAEKPDGIGVAFDLKGPTVRHKMYADYKIHRRPMPDDLVAQMPVIKEAVRAYNIPIYELQGYEADDIMATVAHRAEKKGHRVLIVTSDKDALQLVNKKVKVLNPQKENLVYDEAAVKARYGVGPERVVEVMALVGDASDNIPGVPGIGEKTASELIAEYGNLEGVYKNISKIKGDLKRKNLEENKKQAELSRDLATIDQNVPVEVDWDALKSKQPDTDRLVALYERLEFRSLLKNFPVKTKGLSEDLTLRYTRVEDEKGFKALMEKLESRKEWAFDFETTSVKALEAEPIGVSFSFKEEEAFYVHFGGKLKARACLEALRGLLEDPKVQKIGQNLKYEITILKNFGIELKGIAFDTMVASYCLNSDKRNHNLDDITMEHLKIRITDITELIGTGRNEIRMDQVALDKVYRYGCQDSDVTFRLSKVLAPKLEEKDLSDLFETIEMPLVPVLADMEYAGVAIDAGYLGELSGEMDTQLKKLTRRIYELAGSEFNINSPKQLGEILFAKLGLPVVKKTKSGASTDVEVLQQLSEIHALPKELLKFRELSKLKSTYADALPGLVSAKTGRVHTSFNQTVTGTGRLSSSNPNLQNIPVRTEEGRKIRRAFVTGSKKTILVSADYSQIELRVLAHLSGDKNLVQAFRNGADIHRYTASLVFNVPLEEVTDTMRSSAKTVNFGVLYGMGAVSLSKSLDMSREAAKDFIKAYFDRYPEVKKYLDATLEAAREKGFVQTLFKRRRYIPEIVSRNPRMRSFAERTATNAPIQGTASDIIKIAMVRIAERLKKEKLEARMILQVHDELVFEVPKDELKDLVGLARENMEGAVKFSVPLDVSVKVGPNWLDMDDWT